jgi:hypothetical protein
MMLFYRLSKCPILNKLKLNQILIKQTQKTTREEEKRGEKLMRVAFAEGALKMWMDHHTVARR